jgi:hypothetical protein
MADPSVHGACKGQYRPQRRQRQDRLRISQVCLQGKRGAHTARDGIRLFFAMRKVLFLLDAFFREREKS